jgi:hypothetical protein
MTDFLTPYPVGPMPDGLPMHDDRRAKFDFDQVDTTADEHTTVVRERVTGELFYLTRNTPCGAGCRCAAEIRWEGVYSPPPANFSEQSRAWSAEQDKYSHVPKDYEGEQVTCSVCGHLAPKREFENAPDECSACFIGRVANQLVSRDETEAMLAEMQQLLEAD